MWTAAGRVVYSLEHVAAGLIDKKLHCLSSQTLRHPLLGYMSGTLIRTHVRAYVLPYIDGDPTYFVA